MARVLVLEDNHSIMDLFLLALKQSGHETTVAYNGDDGLKILVKQPELDIIFCDYNMPLMNGYKFTEEVRTNPEFIRYSNIPIIGTGDFDNKEEYLTYRIHKPFELRVIDEMIARYCKKEN